MDAQDTEKLPMMNDEEKTLPEAEAQDGESLAQRARDVAEDAAEVVSDAVSKARETVSESAEKARESLSETVEKAREQAKEVIEKVSEQAKEAADKARETAAAAAEKVTEQAKEVAEKVSEQAKEVAEDVQEAINRTPLGDLIESQKRALSEAAKAIEALIPEATREHGEKALKEMIEGYRTLLTMTAEQVNSLLERAGLKRDTKDEDAS
jgi:vacuolar-type H+-ATPase subunit H